MRRAAVSDCWALHCNKESVQIDGERSACGLTSIVMHERRPAPPRGTHRVHARALSTRHADPA